ncbi:hypothetical protein ACEE12_00820 [Streptococcus suis]
MFETFFEQNQSTYSPITILEGMDAFKSNMKVKNILKTNRIGLIDIPCLVMRQLTTFNWFELKDSSI